MCTFSLHLQLLIGTDVTTLICRGDPIDLVEVDAGLQRVMTVSGSLLKVWTMKGHRLLKELRSALHNLSLLVYSHSFQVHGTSLTGNAASPNLFTRQTDL